jgi:hypothetical protein
MPFIASNLTVLSAANGFTLWHYRTTDSRAETEAPGYFAPAAERARVGDIIMVQANDGTTMLSLRYGNLTGGPVVLDASGTPPTIQRSANFPFSLTLTANPEARAIIFDSLPNAIEPGASIPVAVTTLGNISNVTFQLRSPSGTVLATLSSLVVNRRAGVLFPAQSTGGGYRIRANNTADTSHATLSPPFAIGSPPRLLNEEGGIFLLEQGGQLLLL